jgi:hypothetical protein
VIVDTWTFIWLMVFLKIPIVALFLIVRWAVGQQPESATEQEGSIGPLPRPSPAHPRHPRSPLPRAPRRGPHGGFQPPSPVRVRTATARQLLPRG